MKYEKLFKLMKEKGLTTYKIRTEKIISQSTLQKLREGKAVSTDSISALCKILDCQPGDIMEYTPDNWIIFPNKKPAFKAGLVFYTNL